MTSIRRILTTRVHIPAAICLSMVTAASLSLFAFATADEPQQKPAAASRRPRPRAARRSTWRSPIRRGPGKLIVSLMSGKIIVKGHDANNVIVETMNDDKDDEDRQGSGKHAGLRRIRNMASGLTIEEENNEMRISTQMHNETELSILVPVRTSLKLTLMNGDDIIVDRVEGDLEVNNMNGDISLTNVAGTGIIHSANGEVKAHFSRVTGKPMSFTTMNGDVDVALPADIKATVRLDSGHGDIYTDFAIEMLPSAMQSTVEDNRSKGGKYRIKMEKAMVGKINGGGVEYTLKTMNGDIHLRRYQAGGAPAREQEQ